MRVAVTGATGHLGTALLPVLLVQGHDVRALVHRRLLAGVEAVPGDVATGRGLDRLVRGAEVVVHLAALTSGRSGALWRVNVTGTRNVAAAVRGADARLVHVSSLAVLGRCRDGELAPERELGPAEGADARLDPYALTKAAAERAVAQQAPEAAVVRPGWIMAPGDRAAHALLPFLRRGLYPGLPSHPAPVIDVRDVAGALATVVAAAVTGPLHAAPEPGPSLRALFRAAATALGARPLGLPVPAVLERVFDLGQFLPGLGSSSFHPPRPGTARLRALGWAPRVPLEETARAWVGGR